MEKEVRVKLDVYIPYTVESDIEKLYRSRRVRGKNV
jgi:hypothetical protein